MLLKGLYLRGYKRLYKLYDMDYENDKKYKNRGQINIFITFVYEKALIPISYTSFSTKK